ncbi:DUF664 domain-containing protein [Brevibacterium casei]|nr:DUF664 domain-containing protein [Brevibacterium casei]
MPFFAPPVTTETDAQLSFLEQQCQRSRLTAAGLTDEQARTPTVSSLSIAGPLAHSAHVVYGWTRAGPRPVARRHRGGLRRVR